MRTTICITCWTFNFKFKSFCASSWKELKVIKTSNHIKSYCNVLKSRKITARSIKNVLMSTSFQIFILCRCHNLNCCNFVFSISDFHFQNAAIIWNWIPSSLSDFPTQETHLWSEIMKTWIIFTHVTCSNAFKCCLC